ncbi:MAG: hypothetical protein UW98_C0004G0019 [Parcubacteria group bacterium GW2011_GWC2_45_15]|nr:MAG: hypothetical protein UW98_C0004G0019 [Parcubacteria group bacterium GW2011_GWC2_45_15]
MADGSSDPLQDFLLSLLNESDLTVSSRKLAAAGRRASGVRQKIEQINTLLRSSQDREDFRQRLIQAGWPKNKPPRFTAEVF